jgi:hypothetical protein
MAWERGRYYTRSRKVNGRVVREYVGAGAIGRAAAALDAEHRAMRAQEAAAWQAEKARLDAVDTQLAALDELAGLLAKAVLLAAGFHQHKRQWRRKRV